MHRRRRLLLLLTLQLLHLNLWEEETDETPRQQRNKNWSRDDRRAAEML